MWFINTQLFEDKGCTQSSTCFNIDLLPPYEKFGKYKDQLIIRLKISRNKKNIKENNYEVIFCITNFKKWTVFCSDLQRLQTTHRPKTCRRTSTKPPSTEQQVMELQLRTDEPTPSAGSEENHTFLLWDRFRVPALMEAAPPAVINHIGRKGPIKSSAGIANLDGIRTGRSTQTNCWVSL